MRNRCAFRESQALASFEFSDALRFFAEGKFIRIDGNQEGHDVTNPSFRDRVKSELGDPEFAGSLETKLDFGMFDFQYDLRWIGKQTIDFYETTHSLDGRAPTDPDKFPVVWTPNVFYHSIRVGFEPNKRFRFYAGFDDLFDRAPPFGFDGTCGTGGVFACSASGTGTAIYENIGRFFYAGAVAKF